MIECIDRLISGSVQFFGCRSLRLGTGSPIQARHGPRNAANPKLPIPAAFLGEEERRVMTAREHPSVPVPTNEWPFPAWRLVWPPRMIWVVASAIVANVVTGLIWSEAALGIAIAPLLVAAVLVIHHAWPPPAAAVGDTIVILGCGSLASSLADEWRRSGSEVPVAAGTKSVRIACTAAEATVYIRTSYCDYVVVTGQAPPRGQPPADARGRRPTAITVERLLGRVLLGDAGYGPTLSDQRRWRGEDRFYGVAKRSLDVALALTLGLAVIPLFPLLALLIKLDSVGPVFYSQTRVGLGGRLFRIYKFRTMRQDAERRGAVWATSNDPRTTRVGRMLRLTRIDELPQLWNVLIGDMSLVGPRPERPEFTALLEEKLPAYRQRHVVKPGLTGWAQVCFRYTNSVEAARTKLEYDLYYVRQSSLALDLKILARTILVVLRRQGQ